jgi:predicted DNA-binding protein (MmcQ/YjbR family)
MVPPMGDDVPERLRAICLALPEATEQLTWGDTVTFRVRGRIFVMHRASERGATISCKAPPGIQEMLVGSDPGLFFVPPYVGQHGWIGVCLDERVDWEEVADLVAESYRMTAPKRLVALLGG